MRDKNLLLDHARRYFTQAGQGSDIKKIKMLVELGLEFIRLAEHNERPLACADAATDTPPPAAPDGGGPNEA